MFLHKHWKRLDLGVFCLHVQYIKCIEKSILAIIINYNGSFETCPLFIFYFYFFQQNYEGKNGLFVFCLLVFYNS